MQKVHDDQKHCLFILSKYYQNCQARESTNGGKYDNTDGKVWPNTRKGNFKKEIKLYNLLDTITASKAF